MSSLFLWPANRIEGVRHSFSSAHIHRGQWTYMSTGLLHRVGFRLPQTRHQYWSAKLCSVVCCLYGLNLPWLEWHHGVFREGQRIRNAESFTNNEFISLHKSPLGFYTTHNRQMSLLGQCLRGIVKPQFPSWLSAHFNPLQFCVHIHFLLEKEFTHGKLWMNT